MSVQSPGVQNQSDVNLLFGVLALQLDFIGRDALLAAMNAWVLNKKSSLGEILVLQGAMSSARRELLDTLVKEHLATHANSAEQSLSAIPAGVEMQKLLSRVPDADMHASLSRLAKPAKAGDGPQPAAANFNDFATESLPQMGEPSALRFRLLRPHAKGGLGEVFVALDNELHREVALKQIQDRHADDTDSRQRFVAEAEITGSLEHPSIVPVYGLGQYPDGRPFYAMRFIRGDSLKDAIDRFHRGGGEVRSSSQRGLELRQLLRRFIDVCNAIEYSHSRNVIHRDLKPSNVMLGRFGETFVVDWGLAKPVGRDDPSVSAEAPLQLSASAVGMPTQMGSQIGTPQFMSPEQAAGETHRISFASDVYCLGATLYYLLTGAAPIAENDLLVIFQKVRSGDIPSPRERFRSVPKALDALCRKAMSLDPADRHVSPRALANEIECWLADEPVTSYRETALERMARWSRRHRAWTQAAMGSAVLIAIAATVSSILIQQARRNEQGALTAAENSFQQARKTVDNFFTRVSESRLLNVPGLQPLRRELLQDALTYYQGFLEQRGSDPKLRTELAATHFRIGLITDEMGQRPEAVQSLQNALTMQSELLQETPQDIGVRVDLGNTLNALGDVMLGVRDYPAAIDYFGRAKQQREQAVRENETDPQLRRKVLNSYDNLAIAQALIGAKQEAVASYGQANRVRAQLMTEHPGDPMFKHDLARGRFNLAQLHAELENPTAARELLDRSVELYRELLVQHPTSLDYARDVASVQRLIGDVEVKRSRLEEAGAAYQDAQQQLERLARQNPLVVGLTHELARLYQRLGHWRQLSGDLETSASLYGRSIALLAPLAAEDPTLADYSLDLSAGHLERGSLYASQGRNDEAWSDFVAVIPLVEPFAKQKNRLAQEAQVAARLAQGSLQIVKGELDQSVDLLTLAEGQAQEIDQAHRNDSAKLAVARVQLRLGAALGQRDEVEAGLAKLQSATALLEALHSKHPAQREIALELSDGYARRAELLFALGRHAETAALLRSSIALRAELSQAATARARDALAWAEAAQGLSLVLSDAGHSQDALAAAAETTRIFELIAKRFPRDVSISQAIAAHYLQRIQLERTLNRFDELESLSQRACQATSEPGQLVELARELALAIRAIEAVPEAKPFLPKVQQAAIAAARKAVELKPESRESLRNNRDFEPLVELPDWRKLLEDSSS